MGAADEQSMLFQFQISVAMRVMHSGQPGDGDGDSSGDGGQAQPAAGSGGDGAQPAGGNSSSKKVKKKTLKNEQGQKHVNHGHQVLLQPAANRQPRDAPLPEGSTLISQHVTSAGWLTQLAEFLDARAGASEAHLEIGFILGHRPFVQVFADFVSACQTARHCVLMNRNEIGDVYSNIVAWRPVDRIGSKRTSFLLSWLESDSSIIEHTRI